MKRKLLLKILLGIIALVVLMGLLMTVFIEPWIGKKIRAALNENNKGYIVEVDKIHVLIFSSTIELDSITISSKQEQGTYRDINGKIASIKFNKIDLAKAIFKKDIYISEVIISNSNIKGRIPFSGEAKSPLVSPLNIRIGKILIDKIDLAIENALTAESYSVKEGVLKVYDLQVKKQDTLSPGIFNRFDFDAVELLSVSSDSMYSIRANGIIYSATSNTLAADSFSIQPNYTDYDFTSRYEFQTDRIEAGFSNIFVHDFSAAGYFRSRRLISSYIEIKKMDMKVFRDTRKEFRHVNKIIFQDLLYNYHGAIHIDSIGLISGNVRYTEHVKNANEQGSISFNEIHAKIYKITNDTIYKTEDAFLELKADALLMGKGQMTILVKAKIFDSHNTFSVNGNLSNMEANALNPLLENNAFIYATSGRIDAMNFDFMANNAKATGKMTMLYHGLNIAIKNKQTDDTTAFIVRFMSLIANIKVLDSNPIPDKDVREGVIDYERDPERSFFNYCYKSILSGIKSSLAKSPKKPMKQ